ncbi:unnamed protein product [Oppiella nova]|uniref:Cytochrome P450 n=1 Tax=Oppiella nova TaxID=334625 RepID=A0A7R9MGP8_9ACAR|nr:unnamed protein product [Oppiella nova]CAG2176736.1 unnamed protein product [Oppiella nova]
MYLLLLSMIVVILVILAFLYHKWTFWKRQGIPNDLSSKSGLPFHVTDNESHRKYGKIVGYYEGLKPCLSITDPNLIRKVLVTEFHTFANHRELADENELINNGLFLSRYPNWKRIRAIHSPSFSTGKLKAMKPMIEKTMDQLIAKLDPKASDQQIVDFRQYYDSFTFDVITRAAAGVHTDAIDNPSNNPFLTAVKKTFQRDQNIWNWIVLFMPFMRNFVKIKFFDAKSQEIISESIRRVIRERTEKNIDVPDLLQYSMDYSVLSAKVIRSKEFASFESK